MTALAQLPTTNDTEARWYGDSLFEFLITNEETGGRAAAFIATMPAGFGPPRHVHTREDEIVRVLDGEVVYELDGQLLHADPGATLWLPRDVPHTFAVKSATARVLGIVTPGAFAEMFRASSVPAPAREMPVPGANPLDHGAIAAQQSDLGVQVLGPPLDLAAL